MFDTIFIIGFGSIGKRHFEVLSSVFSNANIYIVHHSHAEVNVNGNVNVNDDATLGKISIPKSKSQSKSKSLAGEFFSYEKALASGICPDLVFICNPSPFHLTIAWKFAKLNGVKGIFIEKPISNSPKNVSDFLGHCLNKGIVVQVGYMLRYTHTLKTLKTLIDNNELGEIYSIQSSFGEYLPSWRNNDYAKGVTAQRELGGGILLEISHEFDYLVWLFGQPINVECIAKKQSKLQINVEDTADLLLEFNLKGKIITANVHLDMLDIKSHRSLRIVGEKGTVVWGSNGAVTSSYVLDIYKINNQLKIEHSVVHEDNNSDVTSNSTSTSTSTTTTFTNRNYILYKQLVHFVNNVYCVQNGNEMESESNNGLDALLIVEKAKEAPFYLNL